MLGKKGENGCSFHITWCSSPDMHAARVSYRTSMRVGDTVCA